MKFLHNSNYPLVVALVITLFATANLSAETIVQYSFSSNLNATTEDANLTASAVTLGSGLSANPSGDGNAGRSGSSNSLFARASVTNPTNQITSATAITANDYFSFTVDVGSGFEMDLTSLTFDLGYTRNGSFEGKQFRTYLLTDIDGFSSSNLVGYDTVDATVNGGSLQYPNGTTTITLSGAQYQNLTGSTEFRLFIADNTGSSDYIHRIDNVTLNGEVAAIVPEPGSLAMLGGLMALGYVMVRRRRA